MSRTDPQFNLRIPEALRDMVMEAAKQNKRSATAEILARLERSFTEPDVMGVSDLERMDPRSVFYTQADEDRGPSYKVDREKLMTEMPRGATGAPGQQEMSEAITRAFEAIQALDMIVGTTATKKGPRPRKKFPRE